MARAIVRYSFDDGKDTRQTIRDQLQAAGFEKIGTASFEKKQGSRDDLVDTLTSVLGCAKGSEGGTLDHLWIYLDDPDLS
jgi:hypothetical protein